jgi:hypothetical protein
LNLNFQICSQIFVFICNCGGTFLIRILHPKWSKYQKQLSLSFYSYNIYSQGTNVLYALIYICLQSCTAMVSHPLPFMASIRHSHCFGYILIAIALHRCVIYVGELFFDVNSTVMSIW